MRRLDDDGEVATWVARGADETVILRVFRETVSDERIDAETLARERLIGASAPELIDVATSPVGRPALVVRAVIGPTLHDLLQRVQSPLRAGHLTTLLAPLAALLAAAHETGATLGRLDARGIRIDPSGRAVVVALGRSAAAAPLPERFRSQEPRIVSDRLQLDALARMLAERVDPHERASVDSAIARGAGRPDLLELALFDCAAPLSIADLATLPSGAPPSEPGPVDDRGARVSERSLSPVTSDTPASAPGSGPCGPLEELGRRLGLPPGLLAPLDHAVLRGLRLLPGRRPGGRGPAAGRPSRGRPRRPVLAVGALGVLCLLVAVGVSVADPPTPGVPSAPAPPGSAAGPPLEPALPGSGAAPGDPTRDRLAELPESAIDPAVDEWAPLVSALVDRWLACAEATDQACAADVAQGESAASAQLLGPAAGRAAAQEVLSSWAAGARASVVVDRHGSAVIVDLLEGETTTASLLVMRSEAGWRVRAVLSGGID